MIRIERDEDGVVASDEVFAVHMGNAMMRWDYLSSLIDSWLIFGRCDEPIAAIYRRLQATWRNGG